ncbi:tetratricopeptide repeat protein [Chamaesiphon sp. VAR_48_metabat_135_sub]|uniref:tetratricopeptide repeat protein n=1 Tax=Chamaesiphon sp. VAR_48_metabat_135_sub TaxID=2964699 RepID=UPI00286B86E0|nr:tetratricopeptide repeat protein [Chamaesiphon sp. VAR_48_metabat_135_sub]
MIKISCRHQIPDFLKKSGISPQRWLHEIDRSSSTISVGLAIGCGLLVNSLSGFLYPQPAQAQVTYQHIQKMGKKVCSFMGGRSKLDGQTLMIMTQIFDQDFSDPNPVNFALNRYVFKNCPQDYLAYEQRKRRNNPFAKNPLLVKTGVPLLSGNSAPLLSGNNTPLLSGNSTPLLSGNTTPLLNGNSTSETAESYREKGKKLLIARNYQEAIVAFDRTISLDSSTASSYYYRAFSFYRIDKLAPALRDLDRAIELKPNYADFYLRRGIVVAAMGDRETALTNYSQAIELNPQLAQAYQNRSLLRRELGDIEGANLDRAKAVKLGINQ